MEGRGIMLTPSGSSENFGALDDALHNTHGDVKDRKCWQKIPKRYILAAMALLGFFNVYALRVNLSVAVVAMRQNRTRVENGTEVVYQEFSWNTKTEGAILASFFYGYFCTQILGGYIASRFGGRLIFGIGILSTAILTLLTPVAAEISSVSLIVLRVIMGIFEGVTYPSIIAVWAVWAPNSEKTQLATIAFSGSYFGTVVSMPVCSLISEHLGWRQIFYIFGSLAILWSICWFALVAESPSKHTTISTSELQYIQMNTDAAQDAAVRVPWSRILRSVSVWAIVAAHFSENWGFYTMLTLLPTFLNDVLKLNIDKAGFLGSLPYLAVALVVFASGWVADALRKNGWSTGCVRRSMTCSGFLAQTVFMMLTAYATSAVGAVSCLTLAVGMGGLAWSGFAVNHLDLAPRYASLLMGISNTVATIPGMLSPVIEGILVTERSAEQWRVIFFISASIYLAGALLYGSLSSGERQSWADPQPPYHAHQDS